jgi:hypothetical protein
MNATPVTRLAFTVIPRSLPGTLAAPALDDAAAEQDAWGSCEFRLQANRVTDRRTGAKHKAYRGWRFAVMLGDSPPPAGRTLFAIPIDPAQLAANGSRYALAQHADQGTIAAGGSAAFTWSATAIGTADPFAAAHEQARQWLVGAGWIQDATTPTRCMKLDSQEAVRKQRAH